MRYTCFTVVCAVALACGCARAAAPPVGSAAEPVVVAALGSAVEAASLLSGAVGVPPIEISLPVVGPTGSAWVDVIVWKRPAEWRFSLVARVRVAGERDAAAGSAVRSGENAAAEE